MNSPHWMESARDLGRLPIQSLLLRNILLQRSESQRTVNAINKKLP